MSSFRPGWVVTVTVGVALVILVTLGTWQMQRLQWKDALLGEIEASIAAAPVAIVDADPVEFAKVAIEPDGISEDFVRFGSGASDGRLTTDILRIVDDAIGRHWLVNLGPVLLDEVPGPMPDLGKPIVGVLRQPGPGNLFTPDNDIAGRTFYSYDMDDLQQAFDRDLQPLFVDTRLIEVAPDIPNNHLVYALTWYGIAAALVGVYIAFGFKPTESAQ